MGGWKIVALLGFTICSIAHGGAHSSANGTCEAQTGAEAMASLRASIPCPSTDVPTSCACSGHKEPTVSCEASQRALWEDNWTDAAADCIKVTPDMQDDWAKHDFHYPSNYANTCDQSGKEPGSYHCTWVSGKESSHQFAIGENYNSNWNSEPWCTDSFCWVDPCNCDKLDIAKSSWLNGFYSYSQCGSEDQYSAPMCSDHKTQAACEGDGLTGCKWTPADAATSATTPAPSDEATSATTPAPSDEADGASAVKVGSTIVLMVFSFVQ